jgi:hypothetical protein
VIGNQKREDHHRANTRFVPSDDSGGGEGDGDGETEERKYSTSPFELLYSKV